MSKIECFTAGVPTMSSREIAELTDKRHDNVKRLIDDLINANVILEIPQIEDIPTATKPTRVYHLGKRETLIVVARLSPEFTARVIDRWQELEGAQAPKLPQSMAQALRLAADQAEQLEAQQVALALAAPKVEFVDRYVTGSTGTKGFREVCKLLSANECQFRDFLTKARVFYLLGGKWTPFQQHIDAGRFEVKTGMAPRSEHSYAQTKFTPKGVEWIAGLWAQHKVKLAQEVEVRA